jgi:hypothetical protein
VRLGDCLPPDHLACFVVDTIAQLDLSTIYARYALRGGQPYAPEILLGLLFYGYATGTFSTRKIERATSETIPFRFIAGNLHPDHDTLATFRKTFLPELKELVVQVLRNRFGSRPSRSNSSCIGQHPSLVGLIKGYHVSYLSCACNDASIAASSCEASTSLPLTSNVGVA